MSEEQRLFSRRDVLTMGGTLVVGGLLGSGVTLEFLQDVLSKQKSEHIEAEKWRHLLMSIQKDLASTAEGSMGHILHHGTPRQVYNMLFGPKSLLQKFTPEVLEKIGINPLGPESTQFPRYTPSALLMLCRSGIKIQFHDNTKTDAHAYPDDIINAGNCTLLPMESDGRVRVMTNMHVADIFKHISGVEIFPDPDTYLPDNSGAPDVAIVTLPASCNNLVPQDVWDNFPFFDFETPDKEVLDGTGRFVYFVAPDPDPSAAENGGMKRVCCFSLPMTAPVVEALNLADENDPQSVAGAIAIHEDGHMLVGNFRGQMRMGIMNRKFFSAYAHGMSGTVGCYINEGCTGFVRSPGPMFNGFIEQTLPNTPALIANCCAEIGRAQLSKNMRTLYAEHKQSVHSGRIKASKTSFKI